MKNFSDLLAINSQLEISIELKIHGCVEYYACVNHRQFKETIKTTAPLHGNINLVIQLQEFDEGFSGIEIVNFSVDQLEVLPLYQHLANPPTNYIDQLGVWRMSIPAPFYSWYHQITGQGWLLKPVA